MLRGESRKCHYYQRHDQLNSQYLCLMIISMNDPQRWCRASRSTRLVSCFLRRTSMGLMLFFPTQAAHAQVMGNKPVSSSEFFIAFCCVVTIAIAALAFLIDLVRTGASRSQWQAVWEFSPQTLGGFSWTRLAFWS